MIFFQYINIQLYTVFRILLPLAPPASWRRWVLSVTGWDVTLISVASRVTISPTRCSLNSRAEGRGVRPNGGPTRGLCTAIFPTPFPNPYLIHSLTMTAINIWSFTIRQTSRDSASMTTICFIGISCYH